MQILTGETRLQSSRIKEAVDHVGLSQLLLHSREDTTSRLVKDLLSSQSNNLLTVSKQVQAAVADGCTTSLII